MQENSSLLSMISFPIRHPWIVLCIALCVAIVTGSGMIKLRFSDDIRVFFDKDNPQLKAYEALEDTYSKSNSVLFVVAPKDKTIFTKETLAAIKKITEEGWKIPYSRRVDSITNFQHTRGEKDDLIVQDLVKDANALSEEDIANVKAVALTEPLLVNRLVSSSGHVAGINVTINLPGVDPLKEQPAVAKAARDLAAIIMKDYPNLEVHLTGLVMINNALAEEGKQDMATLIPAMFLLVLIMVGVLLRNVSSTVSTLMVIIFSITSAMGMAGWVGIVLSPPVSSAANIIMTVAIADSVHVIITFLYGLRQGMGKAEAMQESLRLNFAPVLLTTATTVVGFLGMNFSESPPFRDLGNIVAMGVFFAWFFCSLIVPALMMVLPIHVSAQKPEESRLMDKAADFVIAKRRALLFSVGGVALILALFLPRNQINDEFVKYFDEKLPFRVATDFTLNNLTGFEFIEYSLDSGKAGGISDPAYLAKVQEFADWYRKQPEVKHVYTFTDIMKRLNKNMHGDDPSWYKLPEDQELAAQYLLLYEMSLPFGLDLTDQINMDKSASLFRVSLRGITTNEMLALEKRANDWLHENAKGILTGSGTGQSLMFAHIGSSNISRLMVGSVLSLASISIILIFALRSFKYGMISLIPNLVPAAMAFGLWGMTVAKIGLALSVVVDMTLGIIVDDTVHFLSKYRYARKEKGLSAEGAVRYAFSHIGEAMLFTSIILIVGFSVLIFSNFELNSGMGLMSAMVIAMALISDLFFLSPLLLTLEGKQDDKKNR